MPDSKTIPIANLAARDAAAASHTPLAQASHIPYYFYSDPAILALERERLFSKEWLCVGRVEQIENVGDYLSLDIFGESIIVVRNEQGEINALSNFCLHRGAELTRKGSGNVREFKCPYHSWMYDLSGNLRGAAHMRDSEGFEARSCRLPSVHLDTWGGWIFVNLSPEAPPLETFLGDFGKEFAFLRQEDCRVAEEIVFELDCNWKFVVENLFDVYHVTVIHAGTFGKYRDTIDYFSNGRGQESLFGYYNSAPLVPGGKSLFGNMPWLADQPSTFACSGFLAPNMQMFGRCDAVIVHCIWPLAANKTRMVSRILFPKEFFDLPDFAEKTAVYRDYVKAIIDEDEEAIHSLQRAANSRLFKPGRMSKLEHGVYNVINYYLDRMFAGEKAADPAGPA